MVSPSEQDRKPKNGSTATNRHQRTRYYQKRPRRVPPELCMDDDIESCSVVAALLLYRLISQADDQGRLPGHPRSVKAACFPLRNAISLAKVEQALDEIAAAGFVVRYEAVGKLYIQVKNWGDLQGKWGRRAYPSRFPAPDGWTSDWINAGDGDDG